MKPSAVSKTYRTNFHICRPSIFGMSVSSFFVSARSLAACISSSCDCSAGSRVCYICDTSDSNASISSPSDLSYMSRGSLAIHDESHELLLCDCFTSSSICDDLRRTDNKRFYFAAKMSFNCFMRRSTSRMSRSETLRIKFDIAVCELLMEPTPDSVAISATPMTPTRLK